MKCVLLVHFSSLEEENFHCCCDITSWGGGGRRVLVLFIDAAHVADITKLCLF